MTAAVGRGREGAAAAREKLKPDGLEAIHEEIKSSVDRGGNRADSYPDRDAHIRQPAGVAELVREKRHEESQDVNRTQDGDRIPGARGAADLPVGLADGESVDRVVSEPCGADPKPTTPQVARATDTDHATGDAIEDDRQNWGPNVRAFPGNATGGTPQVAQSASDYTSKQLPEIKWFTFERRKASTNTWAYCVRWYKLDHATGKYDRVAPICVRRVSDATDAVLKRRDTATLKKLVRQWYEEKTGQQFVSAS